MERKLTAILLADVVGYSRLMAIDEEGTHARLKAHLKEFIEPTVGGHHGRVVRTEGDSFLADFDSVVEAVQCAMDVQTGMEQRNADVPQEKQIRLRIGVNMGDVISEQDGIYGSSVNMAARLEGLADSRSVFVSGTVYDHVKGKVEHGFKYLGKKSVKNFPEPVRVYRVLRDGEEALSEPGVEEDLEDAARRRKWRGIIASAVFGVLAVMIAWHLGWLDAFKISRPGLPIPDKPSIAVLPFTNISADDGQEYFADGITEDLITDLSKISGLFVIARNSSFAYKNQSVSIEQVASALGVEFVLEGSVRRSDDKVRVNAQLIDVKTGGHLWAERYDATMVDIFDLQDQVTGQIVKALAVNLVAGERIGKSPAEITNPLAYDALLRGWKHYRTNTPEGLAKALPFLEEALAADPDYGRAHAALAAVYWSSWENAWVASLGISYTDALIKAKQHLRAAMEKPSALAHQTASRMRAYENRHELALNEAKRALELDPNDPLSHLAQAIALVYGGDAAQAETRVREAIRLDPHSSDYLFWLGLALLGQDKLQPARETLDEFTKRNPDDYWGFVLLGSTYGLLEQEKEAQAALDSVNALRAELGDSPYRLSDLDTWPFVRPADRDRIRDGLVTAGVQ